jgi:hypothetical protein
MEGKINIIHSSTFHSIIHPQTTSSSKFCWSDASKDVVDPHLQRRLDVNVIGAGLRVVDRPQSFGGP